MGRGLTACSRQGRDGVWDVWKPERAALSWAAQKYGQAARVRLELVARGSSG